MIDQMVATYNCPNCGTPAVPDASTCQLCRHLLSVAGKNLELGGLWRRFFGHLLDSIILSLTLLVGWLIWFAFTASEGQTPGKKIVGIRCVSSDGQLVSTGSMWLREGVGKLLLGAALGPLWLPNYIWAFFERDKQALHDKMADTLVVSDTFELALAYAQRKLGVPASAGLVVPLTTNPIVGTPRADSSTIADELRRIASLRDEGLITNDEYESKRADLASRL